MTPSGHSIRAVLDANVLYPQFLRDVLLRLAWGDLYEPLWTDAIHDEWTGALLASPQRVDPERIARARRVMEKAFPQARITNYPARSAPEGVHPKDRHVAAAAIHARASHIITFNLRHFPGPSLQEFGVEPIHPDAFVGRLLI